jgi:ribonuclease P protein component
MLFTNVLKDNKDFVRCYKTGRFCACAYITAYYVQNSLPENRIGISVSKKIGNAVERNRAKRIIRAAYRLEEEKFPVGYDIVFVARPAVNGKKTQDIEYFFNKRLFSDMEKNYGKNSKGNSNRKKK